MLSVPCFASFKSISFESAASGFVSLSEVSSASSAHSPLFSALPRRVRIFPHIVLQPPFRNSIRQGIPLSAHISVPVQAQALPFRSVKVSSSTCACFSSRSLCFVHHRFGIGFCACDQLRCLVKGGVRNLLCILLCGIANARRHPVLHPQSAEPLLFLRFQVPPALCSGYPFCAASLRHRFCPHLHLHFLQYAFTRVVCFGKSVHNCFLTQPEIVQAAFGVAQIELCAVQFVSEPVAFADGFCKLAFNVFNFNTRRRKLCAQRIVFLLQVG